MTIFEFGHIKIERQLRFAPEQCSTTIAMRIGPPVPSVGAIFPEAHAGAANARQIKKSRGFADDASLVHLNR